MQSLAMKLGSHFEPVWKVSNKIGATKIPVIAKCTLRTQNVLYAIFFPGEDVAIQVPVKKGKKALVENTSKMRY